jgi:hypothetical protein
MRQFPLLPESELLVWCARTVVSDDLKARIRRHVQAPLNWRVFLKLAEYHGVVPLMSRTLGTVAPDLVPADFLTQLRQRTSVGAMLNQTLAHELIGVCDALQARGVPVIPFKGATLAVQAYGDLTLRDFTDLDLLVPEGSVGAAQAVLAMLGYEERSVVAGESEAHHDGPYQVFVKRRTLCRVDLQWLMAHQHFAFRLDRPEFWARRSAVTIEGQSLPGLAPEDLLLVLCVHGSKHAWEQLKWVCDVAELVRSHPDLNWNQIFVQASTWRCQRMVYLGLSVSHLMLDVPLPTVVLERLKADVEVDALAHRMPASLLLDAREGITEEQAEALYFTLKESWRERWQLGLQLCRAQSPVATTPPSWCRRRITLSRLARLIVPLSRGGKHLLPPKIRRAINRWVSHGE